MIYYVRYNICVAQICIPYLSAEKARNKDQSTNNKTISVQIIFSKCHFLLKRTRTP